jgi:hypothetical protein
MGDERGKTWDGDKNMTEAIEIVNRVSRIALVKLREMGIGEDELVFIPKDGKPPRVNPILQALTLEFLQFEEFRGYKEDEIKFNDDEIGSHLVRFKSSCDIAVSKVMSSPWASISTIRGREISSANMTDIISRETGLLSNHNLEDGDECEWCHNIYGGYSSSNEKFNPVGNATNVFIKKIHSGSYGEFKIVTIDDIPDRRVGWKIILK